MAWTLAVVALWPCCSTLDARTASPQPARQRKSERECRRLLSVEPLHIEACLLRPVLHLGAGTLEAVCVARRHRDEACEAELGVAVGELVLAPRRRFLLEPLACRRNETGAPAGLVISHIRRPRSLDLAESHRRRDRLHRHR